MIGFLNLRSGGLRFSYGAGRLTGFLRAGSALGGGHVLQGHLAANPPAFGALLAKVIQYVSRQLLCHVTILTRLCSFFVTDLDNIRGFS
jgi:hypothetical protein